MRRNKLHIPYTFCDECVANRLNHDTPNPCPFDFNPNLNHALRITYRLKCSSCNTLIPCPAKYIRVGDKITPICEGCLPDYFIPDYDPSDDMNQVYHDEEEYRRSIEW